LAAAAACAGVQAEGDFSTLNAVLQKLEVEVEVDEALSLLLATLRMEGSGTCTGFGVEDMNVTSAVDSSTQRRIGMAVKGAVMSCVFPFEVDPLFGNSATGTITLRLTGTDVDSALLVQSEDFSRFGPVTALVDPSVTCEEKLDLQFEISSSILPDELFAQAKSAIGDIVQDTLCKSVDDVFLSFGDLMVNNTLAPYAQGQYPSAEEQGLEGETAAQLEYPSVEFFNMTAAMVKMEEVSLKANETLTDIKAYAALSEQELYDFLTSGEPIVVANLGSFPVPEEVVASLEAAGDLDSFLIADLFLVLNITTPELPGTDGVLATPVTQLLDDIDTILAGNFTALAPVKDVLDLVDIGTFAIDARAQLDLVFETYGISLPVFDGLEKVTTVGGLIDYFIAYISNLSNGSDAGEGEPGTEPGNGPGTGDDTAEVDPNDLLGTVLDALADAIESQFTGAVAEGIADLLRAETAEERLEVIRELAVAQVDVGNNTFVRVGFNSISFTTVPPAAVEDNGFSLPTDYTLLTPFAMFGDMVAQLTLGVNATVSNPNGDDLQPLEFAENLKFTFSWSDLRARAAMLVGFNREALMEIDPSRPDVAQCVLASMYGSVTGASVTMANVNVNVEGATDGTLLTVSSLVNSLVPMYLSVLPKIVQGAAVEASSNFTVTPNDSCEATVTEPPVGEETEPATGLPTTAPPSSGTSPESEAGESDDASTVPAIASVVAVLGLGAVAAFFVMGRNRKRREALETSSVVELSHPANTKERFAPIAVEVTDDQL